MHAAVCDFIVDCLQNSIEAGADLIELELNQVDALVEVLIRDDGCGMDESGLRKALDPFYTNGKKHLNRKIGLGLPFLKQAVDLARGRFELRSLKGKGTTLEFAFNLKEMDSPPLGRLEEAFLQIFMFDGDHEIVIRRSLRLDGRYDDYVLKKTELIEVLGNLNAVESLILARDFLKNQEENIKLPKG